MHKSFGVCDSHAGWRRHLVTMGSRMSDVYEFYGGELVRKVIRRVPLTYTIDPDEGSLFCSDPVKEVEKKRIRTTSFL